MRQQVLLILIWVLESVPATAQQSELVSQHSLENLSERNDIESGDDDFSMELESFRRNPVDLNQAEAGELRELKYLSDMQIQSLLRYRNLFGAFISIYELQAVPGWDIPMIRKILPYVIIGKSQPWKEPSNLFKPGEHQFLVRMANVLEKPAGYLKNIPGGYRGNRTRYLIRYRYKFKNRVQYGVTLEKDPGERGIDFSSVHFFARPQGLIREVALGDFTVNLGQGLVAWQGMSYLKTGEINSIKQQSPVFKPYSASGEFFFSRGAAITLQHKSNSIGVFVSTRKLTANTIIDSGTHEKYFSSISNSGYHRTENEHADKGSVKQLTVGGIYQFRKPSWEAGAYGVFIDYSLPLKKNDEVYNLFSIKEKRWYNLGMNYSLTRGNFHFFGETSLDARKYLAMVNGVMLSLDKRADLSLLHRRMPAGYQAPLGSAFTENQTPSNETGIFFGLSLRPVESVKIDAHSDFFSFPWLKFRVNAPSSGKEMQVQVTYVPNREFEWYARYRFQQKSFGEKRSAVRMHMGYKFNRHFSARQRVECLWYTFNGDGERGFLAFNDFFYHPPLARTGINFRYAFFETTGYNSRIYAYENDVLYGASVPAFSGRGTRWYFNINYDFTRRLTGWFRVSGIDYPGMTMIGEGNDEIRGSRKTEIKLQFRYLF